MRKEIAAATAGLLTATSLWTGIALAAPDAGNIPETRQEADARQKDAGEKEAKKTGHLPVGEFTLGGVSPGIREETIRQSLGKPIYADFEIIVFACGLIAELDEDHPGIIEEISVARPGTGVTTPAGLTPGLAETAIERAYGKADKKKDDVLYAIYIYYSQDGTRKMKITAKDGIILKIKCETREES